MSYLAELRQKFRSVWPLLDERTRRIMAASEAIGLGYGGVSMVRLACGLSRKAIAKGVREIQGGESAWEGRIRRPGGGRKKITVSDPALLAALDPLIESTLPPKFFSIPFWRGCRFRLPRLTFPFPGILEAERLKIPLNPPLT